MTEYTHDSFVEIPMPGILDGSDHHAEEASNLAASGSEKDLHELVDRLRATLDRSAEYGRTLWLQLVAVTEYLRDDVARGTYGARMLHNEQQWRRWQDVYAAALSALAGPSGDSGYGRSQAQLEMQNRDS